VSKDFDCVIGLDGDAYWELVWNGIFQ